MPRLFRYRGVGETLVIPRPNHLPPLPGMGHAGLGGDFVLRGPPLREQRDLLQEWPEPTGGVRKWGAGEVSIRVRDCHLRTSQTHQDAGRIQKL